MTVTVVGIGADGWTGLAGSAREALVGAEVVLGSSRQHDLLPDDVTARRVTWPSPLMPALPGLLDEYGDGPLAVLASGDPTFYGIGTAVLAHVPAARVLPAPSSLSLACARLGWAAQDVDVVSVVGRPQETVRAALAPRRRLLVLVRDGSGGELAAALSGWGYGDACLVALGSLGAQGESRVEGTASSWPHPPGDSLTVVAVTCPEAPDDPLLGRAPGLPDDAYDHDGQLTKAEMRALSVAALRPAPGAVLWDVGGGAGSIGIEWMRQHPACRAVSVELRADRAARIRENAERLGVPGLQVVLGRAPDALSDLEPPDAVFVGGGVSTPGMLDAAWEALRPGGRLVANTVTVEGEAALVTFRAAHGGALRRIGVERAEPVGRFAGWRAKAGVTQLIHRKEA